MVLFLNPGRIRYFGAKAINSHINEIKPLPNGLKSVTKIKSFK